VIARRSVLLLRVVLPLAAGAVLVQVAYPLVHGSARDALTVAAVVLFAAASLTHAAVTRGPRTALAVLAVFGLGGLLVEAVGVASGVPFGRYAYAGSLRPAVLGVPLVVPLAWVMMGWPAYLVGRRLGAGPGTRLAVAAWALAAWDLFLDPQMVAAGHWRWSDPGQALPGVPAVPLTNYAGWLAVAAVMMVTLRAAAGRAAAPAVGDGLPYALYLWTYLSSVLAHVAFFGLPAAAFWGGLGMGGVAVSLLLVLRRPAPGHTAPDRGNPALSPGSAA
jgi:putative membrane protein